MDGRSCPVPPTRLTAYYMLLYISLSSTTPPPLCPKGSSLQLQFRIIHQRHNNAIYVCKASRNFVSLFHPYSFVSVPRSLSYNNGRSCKRALHSLLALVLMPRPERTSSQESTLNSRTYRPEDEKRYLSAILRGILVEQKTVFATKARRSGNKPVNSRAFTRHPAGQ